MFCSEQAIRQLLQLIRKTMVMPDRICLEQVCGRVETRISEQDNIVAIVKTVRPVCAAEIWQASVPTGHSRQVLYRFGWERKQQLL